MKKLLLTLLTLLALNTAKAQVFVDGDLNKDGVVSISDLTTMVDLLNGKEKIKTPEELIAGKWQTADGDVMKLNEDGTTDYLGAATFKYLAKEKLLYLYDSANEVINLFNVVDITSAYIVLKALGEKESNIYYNEFLIANPVVEVVHDTIEVRNNYIPKTGDALEAIDLALPSGKLWANMNVGANSPEEMGYYLAHGEIYRKTSYTSSNYVGADFKDAATTLIGEGWKIPTKEEMQELINYCAVSNDTIQGVPCLKFTGFNGNSIVLPRNGLMYENVKHLPTSCVYMTKTIASTYTSSIYSLRNATIAEDYITNNSSYYFRRYNGYGIRAIYIPKE